jgi:hypothetical protein
LCAGASATSICPGSTFPYRRARVRPILGQQERLSLLRELLDNDQRPLPYRVAAILLLLYAQPITRISRLTIDHVTTGDDGVWITFDADPVPVPVPEPFADVVRRHLHARPNMMTAR